MKSTVEIIQEAILDICIEPVVENGIFNPHNQEHIMALIEKLENRKIPENIICEAIMAVRQEGKYPERQAYNKEGWLVTFPSPEYKNAAIKKGTHFASDPTHGRGGMNVYYKRKGKQKRMTQQDTSVVEPSQQSQPSAPQSSPDKSTPQAQGGKPIDKAPLGSSGGGSNLAKSDVGGGDGDDTIDFASQYDKDPDALPK